MDDCQWADDLSWQLLARIAAAISERAGHLGLVCSLRPEALARAQAWELPDLRTVRLGPLGVEESRALIGAVTGPVPDELVAYIVSHSFGNPLYTLSTLRALIDSSVLRPAGRHAGEQWTVDTERMQGLPPVAAQPAEAFVTARIAHLHPRTRQAVAQGAVLGRQFSTRDAAGRPAGEMRATPRTRCARPSRGASCAPCPTTAPTTGTAVDLEFTHDRLRDAALRSVGEDERRQLHQRAAGLFGGGTSVRGRTTRSPTTCTIPVRSPRRCHPRCARPRRRCASTPSTSPRPTCRSPPPACSPTPDRFRVHEGLGTVHMLQGQYDLAAEQLEAAYRTAPSLGPLETARVATLLGELAFKSGRIADAEVWTGHALTALRLRPPTSALVAGLLSVFEFLRLGASLTVRSAGTGGAAANRPTTGSRWPRSCTTASCTSGGSAAPRSGACGAACARCGSPTPAEWCASGPTRCRCPRSSRPSLAPPLCRFSLRLAARSLQLREAAHDEWGVAQSLHFRGFVLHAGRRYEEAIEVFDTAIAAFDVLGDRWEQIAARWQQALCLYRLGPAARGGRAGPGDVLGGQAHR